MPLLGQLAGRPAPPERSDGVQAQLGEPLLAVRQHRVDLGDGAQHPLGVVPAGDAADVREPAQRGECAAAEVQAVELHFARGVGEGEGGHQGAQQGALAALRAAGDADVAAGGREVRHQQVADLLERPVDDAHRHRQGAAPGAALGREAVLGVRRERWQQLVQGGRGVQRGQPHLVRGRAGVGELGGGDVQQRAGLLGRRLLGRGLLAGRRQGGRDVRGVVRDDLTGHHLLAGGPAPGPVRAGDVRGLEPGEGGDVAAQEAVAGL